MALGRGHRFLRELFQYRSESDSVTAVSGAQNVQLQNSNVTVGGRDVHITHNHYHTLKNDLKAILDAVANYRKIHQDTLAKATPGTVLWLLECKEFRLFVDADGHLKILWGSGMPGAGKTILASIVINKLESLANASNGQICVGYVYIRYSDQDQVTVQGILESLVKQTVERHSDCADLAQQAYEIHIREKTRPSEEELYHLLSQFIQLKRVTFYVLDALDEAPDRIRLALLQRLASLGARLFITSRPLPTLETKFRGAYTFAISAQDQDLDLHIHKKISLSEHLQDLLNGNPGFRQHLFTMVKEKSGGMFLHATLQLDALQECFTPHAATETLESFPRRIEDVYKQTWRRIIRSDERQASLAKAAFAWVLHAQRSLTVGELRQALATCPETFHFEQARLMPEAVILAACRGLITVDQESTSVRLVHYTAKEPLETLFLTSIPHPHSLLAAVCVTRLKDHGFQNTTLTKDSELQSTLEAEPFLAYAYDAWAFHAQGSLDSDLTQRVVSAFVAGCCAFPMSHGPPFYWDVDIGTPLHVAARYGLPLSFTGPYQAGAGNAPSTPFKRSPLHISCQWGHTAATQGLLCRLDIQVNLADNNGNTGLIMASSGGHEGSLKLLLAHPDIQVSLANSGGYTALILASSRGREGTVKLLLAHPDIQVNLADSSGYTALIWASSSGHEGSVELLLSHSDIQVNLADRNGKTALIYASSRGHEGSVELLLSHSDIQVNLTDSNGNTALIYASRDGHEGIIKLLLSHPSIYVNLSDPHGSTPLQIASFYGHTSTVKLLLAAPGIDVNAVDGDNDTAIKMAAEGGHEDIVQMLLAAPGVDTSVRSANNGHTAMSAAVENGHHKIARLLEEFEAERTFEFSACDRSTSEDCSPLGSSRVRVRLDSLDSNLSEAEYFDAMDLFDKGEGCASPS